MNQINQKQQVLLNSRSYQLGKQAKYYLDEYYYLDGIIGLIPVVGNVVSYGFTIIYIYIAWAKLRSKRLVLVIILNGLKDLAIGAIPIAGVILDFFLSIQ